MDLLWKASGKLFFNRLHRMAGNLGGLLQRLRGKRPRQAGALGRLDEMPPLDIIDFVVPAVPGRHCQFHLLALNLTSIQTRLRRDHIINGGEPKTSPGPQKDAEILGVAIRRADQPK